EEPEEELEVDAEEDAPPAATPLVGYPITPPPLSESSSNSESVAPVVANGTHEMPPPVSTFEVGYVRRNAKLRWIRTVLGKVERRMDAFDRDLRDEVQFSSLVENRVAKIEDNDQEMMDKIERMEKCLETLETNYALVLSDKDSNVKAMMTIEYCPSTEIQRMEQELWTLTLKGDDIEANNNRFHKLALMCPDLVTPEKKKIECLHDAINMARELVEQAIHAKATRIGESNKRKWEDHHRNTSNNNPNNNNRNQNNNNQHQQQNRRQDVAKAYAAAPIEVSEVSKMGHQEKDCKVRLSGAGDNPLQNVTCYGCGEKGHLRNKCPKRTNQQNEGAHARSYVMGTENP
ncbi:putative reverse transcriptase domain-containing protein, partial [Tanacetum coccineum]